MSQAYIFAKGLLLQPPGATGFPQIHPLRAALNEIPGAQHALWEGSGGLWEASPGRQAHSAGDCVDGPLGWEWAPGPSPA